MTTAGGVRTHTRGEPDGILSVALRKHRSLQKKSLTEQKQHDLALYLAQIIQKHPELARLIEAWPRFSDKVRQAITAITEIV